MAALSASSHFEFDRYKCDLTTVKQTLDRYGVAIVPGILDARECQHMVDGMWNTLEHLTSKFSTPIRRTDPASWRSLKHLFPMHSMLIQHWGVGHSQFIWDIRQNPKVIAAFSQIWNQKSANDLLVSFDGASFHMPPESTKCGWYRQHPWWHTDQSYTRHGFECVQGWVTGLDVRDGDATLAVLEGSHKLHAQFQKQFAIEDKDDWFKLTEDAHRDFYINTHGCTPVAIKCPAGSLVLWDSRTIHYGQESLRDRAQPNFRCIAYVCYTPRSMATDKVIQKRIKAFEELRMTTHWPHKSKLFPKMPRTYGAELPEIVPLPAPQVGPVGLKLVGY